MRLHGCADLSEPLLVTCFWFGLMLNVPVNNFSVMLGRSQRFLGITSTFWGKYVLIKDTTRRPEWGSSPQPLDPESEVLTLVLRDPYRSGFTMHVCVADHGLIRYRRYVVLPYNNLTNENPRTIGGSVGCYKHSRFSMRIKKQINLLVLQVNDLVLLEVNAEIARLSICWLSCNFFFM